MEQAGAPVGGALESTHTESRDSQLLLRSRLFKRKHGSPQVSEGHLELQLLFSQRLYLLDEVLEGRLELVPHLSLHLLGVQVVAVVHVLVLAQVGGDLAHFGVKLHVCVASLAEHDGVLRRERGVRGPISL